MVSARNKGGKGTESQVQNTRFIDPVLKDDREDEMNENLGFGNCSLYQCEDAYVLQCCQ